MNRKDKSKQLIDELARMSPEIVELAYLNAINYTLYGIDITEKMETASQNAAALEKAYHEGYNSALARCGHIYKEHSEREVK